MKWRPLRVPLLATLVLVFFCIVPFCPQARADDTSEAEALNDEGKKRISRLDLEGAAEFFRQAIALSPDPRFYFNLCYTLEKSGKLVEAREACDAALGSGEPRLEKKASMLSGKIDEKLGPRPTLPAEETPVAPPPVATTSTPSTGVPPPPPPPEKPPEEGPKVAYGGVFGVALATLTSSSSSDSTLGFAGGPWVLIPLSNRYELVLDAQYVQRGGEFSEAGLDRITITNNYIDLGAAFRYRVGSAVMSYYVEAGLAVSFFLGGSIEPIGGALVEDVNPKDISSLFGLGYVIDTAGGALDLRFRYMIGYLDVNDANNRPTGTSPEILNRAFLLQGGYWY